MGARARCAARQPEVRRGEQQRDGTVKAGQWMRAVVAGAAFAAVPTRAVAQDATAGGPATVPTGAPASQPASLSPEQDLGQYMDRLAANLGQGPQPQRDEAAQRLVDIGSERARTVIRTVLQGSDDRAQNACAKAIADGRVVDHSWLSPLVGMLTKDRTVDAAARALVRYDGEPLAYDPLIRTARLRQQAYRADIIRALGQVVQKPVADALVQMVADPSEEPAVRAAAADALADLSGQPDDGSGAGKWLAWWSARVARNPADWRAQVLAEQHPVLEHEQVTDHERLRQLKQRVEIQLNDEYGRLPPADKPKMLLGLLNDTDPDVREIGARLVPSAIGAGQPLTGEIHNRLIELVGDGSPDVRHQVVTVLKNLADPNALDAILVQLQVENNAQVKVDLLQAIARQQNARARAVPVVEEMLRDPSPRVAAEAASALRVMAPVILTNPARGRQVFQTLLNVMQSRTGPPGMPHDEPGSDDLRAALVAAMAPLAGADPQEAMDIFPQLVNQNESARVRRAAVQGLAPLGERSAEIIAQELSVNNEPDMMVRQAAAVGLGEIGSFIYAQRLYDSTQPQVEPEKLVREAAWKAFQSLLQAPSTTLQELYTWAEIFHRRRELDREVIVRKELARKLQAARKLEALALERQRIGEIYLDLTPPQYAEAVPSLREALSYWEQNQGNNQAVVRLVRELMKALLQSGQFRDAIRFGEQEIRRDASNQDEIGPLIRNAADDLVNKGDPASLRDAATLIGDALSMNPPLGITYRERLNDLQRSLPPAPPGP
jgi:HEAT repeat protein